MLGTRKIQILSFLKNQDHWITSDILAQHIGVNNKLIQKEIQELTREYPDDLVIHAHTLKGYHLEYMSDSLVERVIHEIDFHEENHSNHVRASVLMLYLLFQEDYVSMRELSDIFFVSKTSVSSYIKIIERWMTRAYSELEVTVSRKRGVLIEGSEFEKRKICCTVSTGLVVREAFRDPQLCEWYDKNLLIVSKIVKKRLSEYREPMPGEKYRQICRYIVINLLRTEMGYELEKRMESDEISPLIQTIAEDVATQSGYNLTGQEQTDIQSYIYSSEQYQLSVGEAEKMYAGILKLEQSLIDFLGLDMSVLFPDKETLFHVISRACGRVTYNHTFPNYYAEKIIRTHPFECFLVDHFFEPIFHLNLKDAEFTPVLLYLNEAFAPWQKWFRILLIGNQDFSILNHIRFSLESVFSREWKSFDILPSYLYKERDRQCYDLFLTTDSALFFRNPDFYRLPPVMNEEELLFVQKDLAKRMARLKADKKEEMIWQFDLIHRRTVSDPLTYLSDLCPELTGKEPVHFSQGHMIFVTVISAADPPRIDIYSLEHNLVISKKYVRRVIVAVWNRSIRDLGLFFAIVGDVMNEMG
ncbi:MAG: HTH domain-containing protein [Clostridiales bacterium]|nr:HTH domain-containing protein [Clostridiales bacterium]